MKKILVTTLALSLAVVSALDARERAPRTGKGRRASKVNAQQLSSKTEQMKNAQQDGNTKAAVQLANQVQREIAVDPKAAELNNLFKQILAKENEVKELEAARDALNVSWVGQWTNSDYKSKNAEVKKAQSDLRGLKKQANDLISGPNGVGKDTAKLIKYAALGTTAVALAAGIADWYFDLGYGKAAYKYASESTLGGYVSSIRTKAGEYADLYLPEKITGAEARKASAAAAKAKEEADKAAALALAAQQEADKAAQNANQANQAAQNANDAAQNASEATENRE